MVRYVWLFIEEEVEKLLNFCKFIISCIFYCGLLKGMLEVFVAF